MSDLRCPARRQDHVVAVVSPGHQQRVVGHRAAPREAGPADIVGDDHLDDGVIRSVALHAVRDRHAEGDAAPVGLVQLEVGREDQPRVGVLVDGVGRGSCYVPRSASAGLSGVMVGVGSGG